jgi:hypothetical protein
MGVSSPIVPGGRSSPGQPQEENIRPALLVLWGLLIVDLLILIMELANRASGLFLPFILLEAEGNLPGWLTATQFAVAGILAGGLAWMTAARTRMAWVVLAAAFAFLSLTDGTDLHNRISDYVGKVGLVALLLPFGLLTLIALVRVAGDIRRRVPHALALLIAGLACVAASLIVDGLIVDLTQPGSVLFGVALIVEEILELVAATLLVGATLLTVCASGHFVVLR